MAIFDAMLELSEEQDLGATTSTGSIAATNVLDMVVSDVDLGAGNPVWLNVKVGTEAIINSDSDATLTVALCNESATDATIDGSSNVLWQTAAIAQTALTAGAEVIKIPLPNQVDSERYVGVLYTIGGSSALTAGTINAWLDNGAASSYNTQIAESNI